MCDVLQPLRGLYAAPDSSGSQARISRSTIDEELAADPEMAKKVDKEVVEANYMVV